MGGVRSIFADTTYGAVEGVMAIRIPVERASGASDSTTVRTFCSLCKVICPAVVTVKGGQIISLEPDRQHSRGGAVCAKGRAAPDIHDHPHRVNYPLRRTRPKGDPDPGWERIGWEEALDLIA